MPNEEPPGSPPSPRSSSAATSSARDALNRDFAANAGSAAPAYGDERPIIQWEEGKLPDVVDQAEAALIASGQQLYQRGTTLARVVRRQAMSTRDFERPSGSLGIVVVDKPYLVESMTRAAHFERYDKRNEKWRPTNAPDAVAFTYLARRGEWRLPPLLSVISAPTLRPDGSLLQEPGYDRATATWFDACGLAFPTIADRPTRDDAEDALRFLRDTFKTFPWVKEPGEKLSVDEAVFMSAVLQALVRRSLDTAPLVAFSATTMQAGKSLLASSIGLIANGVGPTIMRYPETNEEAAKLALSVLMQGESVLMLDNVDRPLEGDWLCIILSEEKYSGRMLGSLETIEVPTNITWLATGNNLVIQGDLRTRALLCRIDPGVERPEERTFAIDLRDWIPKNRPQLVAAGLTIMRAWAVSGERSNELCTTWDRFKRWSTMVRSPLLWLGMADPCESLRLLEKEDPKRITLTRLLVHWQKRFQEQKVKASEIITDFANTPPDHVDGDYRELLMQLAADRHGTLRAMKLASYLRGNVGRIVNGLKLEKVGEQDGTALWRVSKQAGRGGTSGT